MAWLKKNGKKVRNWLEAQVKQQSKRSAPM